MDFLSQTASLLFYCIYFIALFYVFESTRPGKEMMELCEKRKSPGWLVNNSLDKLRLILWKSDNEFQFRELDFH